MLAEQVTTWAGAETSLRFRLYVKLFSSIKVGPNDVKYWGGKYV